MCIDAEKQLIFLLGGWDGKKELSDFWVFDIANCRWHCISEDMAADGVPSARSCHKFCIDTKRRHLYLLGRFLDACTRGTVELKVIIDTLIQVQNLRKVDVTNLSRQKCN